MQVQRNSCAAPSDPFPASGRKKGWSANGREVLPFATVRTRQAEIHSLPVWTRPEKGQRKRLRGQLGHTSPEAEPAPLHSTALESPGACHA